MLEFFIYNYGSQILLMVLCAIFGTVGFGLRKIVQKHFDDEAKRVIARIVVQFVEQVWKHLHGPEKLQKALETAQEMLAKKNIDFDTDEMMVLIEAAVAEFNEAFRAPLLDEGEADAPCRVEDNTPVTVTGLADRVIHADT